MRGRFRSFLLGALTSFLAKDRVRSGAAKRGSGELPLSLEALIPGAGEPAVPAEVALTVDASYEIEQERAHLHHVLSDPTA